MLIRTYSSRSSHFYWLECKMVQSLWKTIWQFLTKLNILFPPWQVWLSWLGIATKQKVARLIPGQGTCLGFRFSPQLGHIQEATDQCFSPSLSPSFPFSLKIKNKIFKKLNILFPLDPTIIFFDIPVSWKLYVHTKTCTWVFIAASFIIARTWKQPRSPSVSKWEMWYIQIM